MKENSLGSEQQENRVLERTRTNDLRQRISKVIDKRLILVESDRALDKLIGIKISLIKYRDSRISHQAALDDIFEALSSESFVVQEADRLRLKHLILPKLDTLSLSWDSASKEVPFWSALELFECDLQYLLSDELSHYLPASCVAARNEVLAKISNSRIHAGFGRGSKVSREQYGRLMAATEGGWMRHLAELGIEVESESVYELGEPRWHGNALTEDENDLLPWNLAETTESRTFVSAKELCASACRGSR